MIEIIAAMTKNRIIGRDNQMPWHVPAEMKHFRQKTLDHTIVMGRKTYESIGRPLPNRDNYVLSKKWPMGIPIQDLGNWPANFEKYITLEEIDYLTGRVFIIGGSEIYRLMIPKADLIHLSVLPFNIPVKEGDKVFPEIPTNYERLIQEDIQFYEYEILGEKHFQPTTMSYHGFFNRDKFTKINEKCLKCGSHQFKSDEFSGCLKCQFLGFLTTP